MSIPLVKILENEIETPHLNFTATLGFDGFVDTIVKLVHHHDENGRSVHFDLMKDWGTYITDRAGKNFTVEFTNVDVKFGGNMPIMANALANLGLKTNCIGAMGYPKVHEAFHQMSKDCNLLSFAVPGFTQALEFKDGKIMLGNIEELNHTDWLALKNRIGENKLISSVEASSLICLVNWGELEKSTEIWRGMIKEILPQCRFKSKPIFFFDLSDFSKRNPDETREILKLINENSSFGKTILGLNQNEAHTIFKILFNKKTEENDLVKLGQRLFEKLTTSVLLLHHRNEAVCLATDSHFSKSSLLVEHPKLLTGAGDNFNAGFCYGQLLQMPLEGCLSIAHLAAHCYVRNGESPDLKTIIASLKLNPVWR